MQPALRHDYNYSNWDELTVFVVVALDFAEEIFGFYELAAPVVSVSFGVFF
jgi:hypothetical protein